ncbi:MAG: prolyl oligopeptidase family serine peptidase [Verrucomicrobiota bacterium]
MKFGFVFLIAALLLTGGNVRALEPIPPIERRLPPQGTVEISSELKEALESQTADLEERLWEVDFHENAADVGMLVKAVRYALDHGEFYSEKEIPIAAETLELAQARWNELGEEKDPSWLGDRGLVVRGFESAIDESYQPYGLEIPESLDLSKPVPLLVWLHGRGDKVTDLHFLKRCLTKSQAFGGFVADQEEVIILHPFGRQCVGWKHAGEIDVFEAIAEVKKHYPIDPDRIALAGFSMGGAGAWHIGAHYRDQFCAVHAGAGFVETKEYNRLTPDQYPAEFVQTLWQLYDVPYYKRNLLNGPLLAYSGSEDKQKQAADLMARELEKIGYELRHVVGEGMEHKYNEESVSEIWEWLREAWEKGRPAPADRIVWETPTLRYPGFQWLQFSQLSSHWSPSRAESVWDLENKEISIESENVTALSIAAGTGSDLGGTTLRLGEQELLIQSPGFPVEGVSLVQKNGSWTFGEVDDWSKRPGVQGPIDDAFLSRFIVVPPDKAPNAPHFARWVQFELNHFRARWKGLMRGKLLEISSDDLNSDDIREANLVLWGDPESNAMIAEIADQLPVEWTDEGFTFRGQTFLRDEAVPVFIFPNPLNPNRYIVLNSGLTFRENHDRTNSQQNPKLPDWAILGLDQLPDAEAAGRVIEAGFFDELWR